MDRPFREESRSRSRSRHRSGGQPGYEEEDEDEEEEKREEEEEVEEEEENTEAAESELLREDSMCYQLYMDFLVYIETRRQLVGLKKTATTPAGLVEFFEETRFDKPNNHHVVCGYWDHPNKGERGHLKPLGVYQAQEAFFLERINADDTLRSTKQLMVKEREKDAEVICKTNDFASLDRPLPPALPCLIVGKDDEKHIKSFLKLAVAPYETKDATAPQRNRLEEMIKTHVWPQVPSALFDKLRIQPNVVDKQHSQVTIQTQFVFSRAVEFSMQTQYEHSTGVPLKVGGIPLLQSPGGAPGEPRALRITAFFWDICVVDTLIDPEHINPKPAPRHGGAYLWVSNVGEVNLTFFPESYTPKTQRRSGSWTSFMCEPLSFNWARAPLWFMTFFRASRPGRSRRREEKERRQEEEAPFARNVRKRPS